jgi:hypothetical protein
MKQYLLNNIFFFNIRENKSKFFVLIHGVVTGHLLFTMA